MKSANIQPIPTINNPKTCSAYRPVSVTPILALLLERIFVQKYVAPVISSNHSSHSVKKAPPTKSYFQRIDNDLHAYQQGNFTMYC